MNNISTKIMLLRKQNGMSQADLAKKLNVSNKLISKWETGGSLPSTEYLPKLCQIFNIKINELMGEEDFPEVKSNYTAGRMTIITIFCLAFFCIFIAFCHLTLAPAVLKKPFINDIDNHIEKTFKGTHYYLTTTVEIDDVPTVTEEYGYVNNGKVEYIEYVDDELQCVIKDGVKYDAEEEQRELFDNSQIKNLWELYEYSAKDEENFDVVSDDSFIDYIYKQFNGYYFEVNKGVINRFIDEELESDIRVTSKIKGDVDFSKGKLKSMTMSFKAKSNNVPIDVKITQKFNLTKAKQTVKFPDDINSKLWTNIELKLVDDLVSENKVEKLNLELPNLYKSNNNIVSYDEDNIYLYNEDFEITNTIPIHADINMKTYMNEKYFYFNVKDKYVVIKETTASTSDLYILNLESQDWIVKNHILEVYDISPNLNLYYNDYKNYNTQITCYNLKDDITITLIGTSFIGETDGAIFTEENATYNDVKNGIYKYKDGISEFISTELIASKCYIYNNLILTSKTSAFSGSYIVYNENFEVVNHLPFAAESIVFNADNIFCVGHPSKYYVGCRFYNYDNLFVPPLRLNIEYVIAFEDYYLAKKVGENTLYKIYKDYLNELGGW